MDINEFAIVGAALSFKSSGRTKEEIEKEYGAFWNKEELDKIFELMKEI